MIRGHKFYEMQGALAAVGQLSDDELAELEQHVNDCLLCREYIADMAEMSREFFLMQPRRVSSNATPAGMQERFFERAAKAGIPISRPANTILDARFARAAMIAVLLTISIALSWKLFSAPYPETAIAQDSRAPEASSGHASEKPSMRAGEHTVQTLSASNSKSRRKTAVQLRSASISSTQRTSADRHPDLIKPFFAKQAFPPDLSDRKTSWTNGMSESYRVAGMYAPIPSPFPNTYVANLLGSEKDSASGDQAFHYDLKLASLSFLESSPAAPSEPHVPGVKFNAPILHLDPNRVW
jgi:hypothetical protein